MSVQMQLVSSAARYTTGRAASPVISKRRRPEPVTRNKSITLPNEDVGRLFIKGGRNASSKLSETRIGREVERMFGEISAKRGDLCTNPVTGGEFVFGFDPIRLQKKIAYHALLAREDFALNGC
jgi:hypothetical protein